MKPGETPVFKFNINIRDDDVISQNTGGRGAPLFLPSLPPFAHKESQPKQQMTPKQRIAPKQRPVPGRRPISRPLIKKRSDNFAIINLCRFRINQGIRSLLNWLFTTIAIILSSYVTNVSRIYITTP